jgi:hypothetical protein
MSGIQDPRNSRPIDVHRWSDHPEVKGLTDRVWREAELDSLVGTAGPKPKRPFVEQLRVLLLDLYVAWLENPDLSIGVSMDVNSWKTGSRYNALHLSKRLLQIIPALHESGLIDMSKGSYNKSDPKWNRTTRIRASGKLQGWFADARFTRHDIGRAVDEETIILKDESGRKIEYADTPETVRMREELRAYNELIASSFVDIRTLEQPVLEITGSDGVTRSIWLDGDACRTHRVFGRSSWEINGRFYGGWWQSISSKLRSQICIDNEPTIEVDFQGLHIAMLYAKAGQDMTHDPYQPAVDSFSADQAAPLRSLTKDLVLKAINAKDKSSAYNSFRSEYPSDHVGRHMTNAELDRLMDAFLRRNPCLRDYLFDDQGIRLMYADAQITERVHRHFTQKGIPVLSVHDSYIIDIQHVDELRQVMAEASEEVVGRPLRCGVDIPGFGEFDDVPDIELKSYLGRLTWDVYGGEAVACRGYVERMLAYERRTGRRVSSVEAYD